MRKQRELVARLHTSLLSGASVVPVAARDIRQRAVPAQVVLTEKRSPRVTELKGWLPDAICRLAAAYQEPYVTISRAELEYPQILSAFDAVADWITRAGLSQAGPPREVYRRDVDVAAAAPAGPVCDIAFPVRGTIAG